MRLRLLHIVLFLLVCGLCHGQDAAILAIRSLTDPAKIATLKDPRACNDRLLKVVYWLHNAQATGSDPAAVVNEALVPQVRRELVAEALLRKLVISSRLGLLTPVNLAGMKRGTSPIVSVGPYAGEVAEVDHILPVAKFPKYAKEFWNLELLPRSVNRRKSDSVGQRQLDLLMRVQ